MDGCGAGALPGRGMVLYSADKDDIDKSASQDRALCCWAPSVAAKSVGQLSGCSGNPIAFLIWQIS